MTPYQLEMVAPSGAITNTVDRRSVRDARRFRNKLEKLDKAVGSTGWRYPIYYISPDRKTRELIE